jgi:hypothetical protein
MAVVATASAQPLRAAPASEAHKVAHTTLADWVAFILVARPTAGSQCGACEQGVEVEHQVAWERVRQGHEAESRVAARSFGQADGEAVQLARTREACRVAAYYCHGHDTLSASQLECIVSNDSGCGSLPTGTFENRRAEGPAL